MALWMEVEKELRMVYMWVSQRALRRSDEGEFAFSPTLEYKTRRTADNSHAPSPGGSGHLMCTNSASPLQRKVACACFEQAAGYDRRRVSGRPRRMTTPTVAAALEAKAAAAFAADAAAALAAVVSAGGAADLWSSCVAVDALVASIAFFASEAV